MPSKPSEFGHVAVQPTNEPVTIPLAELKRRLPMGTRITLVGAPWLLPDDRLRREVARVQSNAVMFRDEHGRESWLYWTPGTRVVVEDNAFEIHPQAGATLRYQWGWD